MSGVQVSVEGDKFVCHVTGREYNINSRLDFDSSFVVYLLGCKVLQCSMLVACLPPFVLGLTVISRVLGDLRKGRWLLRQIFIGIWG